MALGAEGDAGRDNSIFTSSTTNTTNTGMGDGDGDETGETGDGGTDPTAGDGDGDPSGDAQCGNDILLQNCCVGLTCALALCVPE